MLANASMDDKLDELYFCLPVMWGDAQRVASELGISRVTLLAWLRRLEAEGLVENTRFGCWLERFD